jgi:phenylalanyl-tRNA synthetase beta chain
VKIAYSWLREYVRTTTDPDLLGEKFQMTSSALEEVEHHAERFASLTVGRVESVRQHPNADRLRIAEVSLGKETRQIVCGAPNLANGQLVVVALPGTLIHPLKGEPVTIQESVIRGEASQGMLCSAQEIGLDLQTPDGILVLPEDSKPGSPLSGILEIGDSVLDLELTSNRPDLYSYIGLAREVAAFEKHSLVEPPIAAIEESASQSDFPVDVRVENSHSCTRYSALCMDGISVGPSPLWMQVRLLHSGIRPINNVVDVGNYVMLEFGQPLHTFDLDRLVSKGQGKPKLDIRMAKPGESLELLNGKTIALNETDLVIAADGEVTNLAGIMGGESTGIQPETVRVLIESAHFHAATIRRSGRAHGLRSDASARFEKGLDPEMTVAALKRAAYLLQKVAGGRVSSPLHDSYPARIRAERPRIHVSFARVQQLLGINVSAAETKSILQKLGFQLPLLTKSSFEAVPPSWRRDVTLPEDIVEELIRLWGFDRLPSTLPTGAVKAPFPNSAFEAKSALRHGLAALGMYETCHQPFAPARSFEQLGIPLESVIRLPEPLSRENEYLITTLAVPLLQNIALTNVQETELGLFEIGHVFLPPRQEREQLVLLWRSEGSMENLYRAAKTALQQVIRAVGQDAGSLAFLPSEQSLPTYMARQDALELHCAKKSLGVLGQVNELTLRQLKIRSGRNVLMAVIDLELLLALPPHRHLFAPVSAYPGISRDLTLVLEESLPVERIGSLIAKHAQPLLRAHEITRIYRGKSLGESLKSVTVHLEYGSPERTLTDGEVAEDQERLKTLLATELPARLT